MVGNLSKESYVVSTALLSLNDKAVVRSLCMLLSAKFLSTWIVSSEAEDGDVLLSYEESDVSNASLLNNFRIVLFLSPSDGNSALSLRYPLRPNNLVEKFNQISKKLKKLDLENKSSTHEQHEQSNDPNQLLRSRKIRSLRYFKRLFLGNEKLNKDKKQSDKKPEVIEEHVNKDNALNKLKERFSSHYVAAFKSLNFVFLGTPGSGKTTAINAVGDVAIKTEVMAQDSLHAIKPKTTVALDYNEVNIDEIKIKLFGNPGQIRFDYMWSFTCRHADVFVVLIDATSPNLIEDFSFYWNSVRMYYIGQPLAIGLTHTDLVNDVSIDKAEFQAIVGEDAKLVLLEVDPRSTESVILYLQQILKLI